MTHGQTKKTKCARLMWRLFKLLLWKNLLVRKKHWISMFVMTLLIPFFIFALVQTTRDFIVRKWNDDTFFFDILNDQKQIGVAVWFYNVISRVDNNFISLDSFFTRYQQWCRRSITSIFHCSSVFCIFVSTFSRIKVCL